MGGDGSTSAMRVLTPTGVAIMDGATTTDCDLLDIPDSLLAQLQQWFNMQPADWPGVGQLSCHCLGKVENE